MSEEQVLVLARSALLDGVGWRGMRVDGIDPVLDVIASEARFEPRGQMEHDPSWKQIIPYLVLRDGRDYYLMRRTRAGADRRLHDRYSIGVGGHINPGDGGLLGGLRREWQEELEADFEPEFRLVGLLNDDATDVGSTDRRSHRSGSSPSTVTPATVVWPTATRSLAPSGRKTSTREPKRMIPMRSP